MPYEYFRDDTYRGNPRFSRRQYEFIQEALELLLAEISTWNQRAQEHGAVVLPYEREAEDLEGMVEWGRHELARTDAYDIRVQGISVGSLRYIKAGLVLLSARHDAEVESKIQEGWPSGVISSMQVSNRFVTELAAGIDVPPADILAEITVGLGRTPVASTPEWDVFVCHASEDKEIARPLADGLRARGLRVWLDETTLQVGDSLRRTIDRGLARSRFGAVILSPSFLQKEWPQRELDGLAAQESAGRKVILPVWHEIDFDAVRRYSPTLADRLAAQTIHGLDRVVEQLFQAIGG